MLDADLTIAAKVSARLFAATTGSDADRVVKLFDVCPEQNPENRDLAGYQFMVSSEVFRGRYRKGLERPEAIHPGEVLECSLSLHTQGDTFLEGHRLMVQVQGTWFPLVDRNPRDLAPNIVNSKAGDFR